jgi:hypothetical protein
LLAFFLSDFFGIDGLNFGARIGLNENVSGLETEGFT